jgi:hypothetical protein
MDARSALMSWLVAVSAAEGWPPAMASMVAVSPAVGTGGAGKPPEVAANSAAALSMLLTWGGASDGGRPELAASMNAWFTLSAGAAVDAATAMAATAA